MGETLTPAQFQQRYGGGAPSPGKAVLSPEQFQQMYGGQQEPSMFDTVRQQGSEVLQKAMGGDFAGAGSQILGNAGQSLLGAGKGLAESLYNSSPVTMGAKLGQSMLGTPGQYGQDESAMLSGLQPANKAQEVGNTAERVMEFLAPGMVTGGLSGAGVNASRLAKLENLGSRALTEGALSAGVGKSQGQSTKDAALSGAMGAAVPFAAGAKGALKAAAGEKLAPRIINSLVKPISKEFEFGKNAGRGVASEGIVANSMEDLAKKIGAKSDELGKQVDAILKPITKKIDITAAFKPVDEAIAQAVKDGDKALLARLRHFKDQLTHEFAEVDGELVKAKAKPTKLTPYEANQVKREIGRQTKWREGDQYADDLNKLGVQIWRGISEMIEAEAPLVKGKNARWADIISADKAIKRRATIEARRDLVSLPTLALSGVGALAGGSPGAIAGAALKYAGGTTAVRTRGAAALAAPSNPNAPLLELLRAILSGTGLSPQTGPSGQQ